MDIDDIPVPVSIPVVKSNNPVPDEFDYPVAVKFGFIGLGQGGGRLAETFYKLGYRNVVAINTTDSDLKQIKIPEENKLNLNVGGAGKSLTAAATAAAAKREDIYALIAGKFSAPPELTFLCFGMGGGTGTGVSTQVGGNPSAFSMDTYPGTLNTTGYSYQSSNGVLSATAYTANSGISAQATVTISL